jgi:hypothetical protein
MDGPYRDSLPHPHAIKFWCDVYLAYLAKGCSPEDCAGFADAALVDLTARMGVR